MAEVRLTVRKDVNLLIFRILVKVQSSTIVDVSVLELKFDLVLMFCAEKVRRQENPVFLEANLVLCCKLPIDLNF